MKSEEIYKGVSNFYAGLIKKTQGSENSCCCSQGAATGLAEKAGYTRSEIEAVPQEAACASFGCGNPMAFAGVKPGETVLDLGSGAGIDCFLAATRVGESGKVIGLDMTEEMVKKAQTTATENGYDNIEFRLGRIEEMPVDSASVDWVISNCVINLSPEKKKVFAEVYRVLKPGGQFLISDVVAENLPDKMREDIAAWASCIAGAVSEDEYLEMIRAAGFKNVEVVDRVDYMQHSESQPLHLSSIRVKGIKNETTNREKSKIKNSLAALDRETQLLVAAGSAVAAGCTTCLQTIVNMARAEGIEERKLKEAVMTGQYVKEQPNTMMKQFADDLVGTHLQSKPVSTDGGCPLSRQEDKAAKSAQTVAKKANPEAVTCGCSSARR